MDEAIAILKLCADDFDALTVHALYDGDDRAVRDGDDDRRRLHDASRISRRSTSATLARRTLITTNVVHVLEAANGKPIIFMPARHDHHRVQTGDGYAAYVAGQVVGAPIGVTTDEQASWWGGTRPRHRAARADRGLRRRHGRGGEALRRVGAGRHERDGARRLRERLGAHGARGRRMRSARGSGASGSTRRSRSSTARSGRSWATSGRPASTRGSSARCATRSTRAGFERVRSSSRAASPSRRSASSRSDDVPVDAYGVGSSLIRGSNDFTARHRRSPTGEPSAKVGRRYCARTRGSSSSRERAILWDVDTQVDFVHAGREARRPGAPRRAAGDGAARRGGARGGHSARRVGRRPRADRSRDLRDARLRDDLSRRTACAARTAPRRSPETQQARPGAARADRGARALAARPRVPAAEEELRRLHEPERRPRCSRCSTRTRSCSSASRPTSATTRRSAACSPAAAPSPSSRRPRAGSTRPARRACLAAWREGGVRFASVDEVLGRALGPAAVSADGTLDGRSPSTSRQFMSDFALTWIPVLFFLLMCVVVYLLWRTVKLMPRVKPMEITPGSASVGHLGRRRRPRRGEGGAAGDRRLPARPGALRGARRARAEGHPLPRPARHRQDARREGGRERVRRALLRAERLGVRRDVRRPRRRAHPQALRGGAQERAVDRLHRRARRRRQARSGHGFNREQDQTLNQLLVELDGFGPRDQVVVMGASNRLQDLDPALLRPGRFDRQILIQPPDLKGRSAILAVHTRGKPLAEDVDLDGVARQTAGLTGADLANICNEAAIARRPQRPRDARRMRTSTTRSSASSPACSSAASSPTRRSASSPTTRAATRSSRTSSATSRRRRRSSRAARRSATCCTCPRRSATSRRRRSCSTGW